MEQPKDICECCRQRLGELLEGTIADSNGMIHERNKAIEILEALAEIKGKLKLFDDRFFDYEDEIVEILTGRKEKAKMKKSGKGIGEVYKNAVTKRGLK